MQGFHFHVASSLGPCSQPLTNPFRGPCNGAGGKMVLRRECMALQRALPAGLGSQVRASNESTALQVIHPFTITALVYGKEWHSCPLPSCCFGLDEEVALCEVQDSLQPSWDVASIEGSDSRMCFGSGLPSAIMRCCQALPALLAGRHQDNHASLKPCSHTMSHATLDAGSYTRRADASRATCNQTV